MPNQEDDDDSAIFKKTWVDPPCLPGIPALLRTPVRGAIDPEAEVGQVTRSQEREQSFLVQEPSQRSYQSWNISKVQSGLR